MIDRLKETLERVTAYAEQLPVQAQEDFADLLSGALEMVDTASSLAGPSEVKVSFGGLGVSFSPKNVLEKLSKIAPPLKVNK